jgi:Tol biopolymer transport system component
MRTGFAAARVHWLCLWVLLALNCTLRATGTPEPGEAELSQRLDTQLNILAVDWQPNGDWIVFVREADGPGETMCLWKVRSDGTGLQQITSPGRVETPRWSPDGTQIAFVRDGRAWLINDDGSGARLLNNVVGVQSVIAWSPDGTRIALAVERGEDAANIALYNAATGGELSFAGRGTDGDWHPSGNYIVTSWNTSWRDTEMYAHLLEIDISTKVQRQLTSGEFDDWSPRYSPDGQWVYFISWRRHDPNDTSFRLCRVRREGGTPEVLTRIPDMGESYAIAHDGQRVVFVNAHATDLYICRVDGTDMRRLTHFYPDGQAKGQDTLKVVKAAPGTKTQSQASSPAKPAKPVQPAKPAKRQQKRAENGPFPWLAPPIPLRRTGAG